MRKIDKRSKIYQGFEMLSGNEIIISHFILEQHLFRDVRVLMQRLHVDEPVG